MNEGTWLGNRVGRSSTGSIGVASLGDSSGAEQPEVSVVIPCLNEARTLASCLEQAKDALLRADIRGEIVVADNGSSDGSIEIATHCGARVVSVLTRGYGSALRGGMEEARADLLVLADADGQHDFDDVPRIVEKLREGYDLVVGNRLSGEILPGAMSWSHRYIGNPVLSGLIRALFHPGVRDAQSGMRGLTRRAFFEMDLRTSGFEISPEMVVKAAYHHLRMTEIPITVLPDGRARKPHLRTLPDGWRHLAFILMCSPNYLFVLPGTLLLMLGVFFTSWLAAGPHRLLGVGLDTRAQLFAVILASFGLQVICIGLFARVFSYSEPARARRRSVARFLKAVKLEEALAVGVALVVAGIAGDLAFVVPWASNGFGILHGVPRVIFWSLWLLLGLQICFSSFFLSMIGISRGTWIGERLGE